MEAILDKIAGYVRKNISGMKVVFIGDPIAIPSSLLPAAFVEGTVTRISSGPTGMDELRHEITVGLVLDKRTEINADEKKQVAYRKLLEFTQARDENGNFKDSTVCGILRKNFTLAETVNDQQMSVSYGLAERPNGGLTAEARVTVIVTELVSINRT